MTDVKTTPNSKPYPPVDFWRALYVIYRHFLQREVVLHRLLPEHLRLPPHVLDACQVIDCWRDIAFQEGWLWFEDDADAWLE
jgi:hypothetical protein